MGTIRPDHQDELFRDQQTGFDVMMVGGISGPWRLGSVGKRQTDAITQASLGRLGQRCLDS